MIHILYASNFLDQRRRGCLEVAPITLHVPPNWPGQGLGYAFGSVLGEWAVPLWSLVCGIFTGWSLEARPGYCGLALGHRCVLKELTETVYLDSRCDRGAPSLQIKGTNVGTRCKVTLGPEQAGP